MKNGKEYEMFQYKTESRVPRPESFCADVLTALALKNASENNKLSAKQAGDLFQNLASAAESGWDFSC
jgi:neutral trehalase